YPSGIRALDENAHVISRQCPLFVPLVEEGWLEHPATDVAIAEYLADMKKEHVDTLVFGCTHYPLLRDAIQKYMGSDVELICSSEAVAAEVKDRLGELNYLREEPGESDSYFLTDHSATFQRIMKLFMGDTPFQVEQVDIGS
ncbi:MAG: hypothetical protein MI919_36730, partial [Holophagales bacterium]|nr:hypothetical protein [Holophagales bacterium]